MGKGFTAALVGIVCMLGPVKSYAQSVSDTMPHYINFDSLSLDDKELLSKYKGVFEDDFNDFLDIFKDPATSKVDTTVYDMDRSSHVEVGLDFVSSNLINGRLTGINGAGFFPYITYFHKTGIYFGITPGFYTDRAIVKVTDVPLVTPSAGFQRTFFKRWFSGIAYSHNFITYGSAVSRRLLDNTFSLSTSVDIWKHFIIAGTASVYWSSDRGPLLPETEKFSSEITLSLRKEFCIYKFIGAKIFTITPALNFYFGNDNRELTRELAASEAKGDTTTKKEITKVIANNYFGFLDIEPSVAFDWRIRNLDIYFTPTLAIPFNTLDTKTDKRTYDPKIYRFYVQVGIKYLFCVKQKKKRAGNTGVVDSMGTVY